jgi:hypothetical protein
MERKNKCKKLGFSAILWAVMAVLLSAAPALAAYVYVEVSPYNNNSPYDLDFDSPTDDYLINVRIDGILNLWPGGYASYGVFVNVGGNINIYGSHEYSSTDTSVQIAASANVKLFTDSTNSILFEDIDGDTPQIGSATLNGTTIIVDSTTGWTGKLTWVYEGEQYSINIGTSSDITVEVIGGGGPIEVQIDIKPGSYPNSINLGSKGVIPVAILSTDIFDATTVDAGTVELAGAGVAVRGKADKLLAHEEDVNNDGLMDLVCQVETENLDPGQFQDGYAVLTGNLLPEFEGSPIEGLDEITIVP